MIAEMLLRRLAALLALAAAACGCATVFQGTTQMISVTSDPPGARVQVFEDDRPAGEATTPAAILVKKDSEVALQMALPGRAPVRFHLDRSLSGGFLADLGLGSPLGIVVDLVTGAAWKHEEAVTVAAEPRPRPGRDLRFTAALLAGTGYGVTSGTGDVNADHHYSGSSFAGLGHLVPELGLLSVRDRMFMSISGRYQFIEGATDVYANGRVYHTARSAKAFFSKFGWLLRAPAHRLQPYVSLAWGYGHIEHLAPFPEFKCGPQNNVSCVDTVISGPWFLGAGGGLRWTLASHLQAVLALEAQVSAPQRNYNIDGDLGLAVIF